MSDELEPRNVIIMGGGVLGEEDFHYSEICMFHSPNGKYFANHPIDKQWETYNI